MKTWLGIDPGIKGGLAMIDSEGAVSTSPMPTMQDGKRTVIDIAEVVEWAAHSTSYMCAAIERTHPKPPMGMASAYSFGYTTGQLVGLLQARFVPHVMVPATDWRKKVLAYLSKNASGAITFVGRTYPDVDLRPGRTRKPHDGIAEALCIAHYCRWHSDFRD